MEAPNSTFTCPCGTQGRFAASARIHDAILFVTGMAPHWFIQAFPELVPARGASKLQPALRKGLDSVKNESKKCQ